MKKILVGGVVAVALAVPVAAFADNGQIVALYQQLISLLQQEINILQAQALTISPNTGSAPLTVTFTVNKTLGNEAVDYGDGSSTGSAGCTKNAKGFCDLSQPVQHTYQLPGNYKVTLYRTIDGKAQAIGTYTVAVK